MTLSIIPLVPVPSQTLVVQLGAQSCGLNVRTRANGLFVDLYIAGQLTVTGMFALNLTKMVRSKYLGLVGDLYFYDTIGKSDPTYDGLGSRYLLFWDDSL